MPTAHPPAFTITAFVLIAIPGPSVLFTVSHAITHGPADLTDLTDLTD